jgi:hypothetical protein
MARPVRGQGDAAEILIIAYESGSKGGKGRAELWEAGERSGARQLLTPF